MASMYETIMDLPLFKGVGKDHVSQFVEKTQIHFERYEPGDIIADSKDEVTGLKFVLSGSVVMSSKCLGGKITVESHIGLKPMHKRQIKALTPCGVMGFSKEKYIELLRSDRIYLINFANYLSMFIQQREEVTSNMGATGILRVLAEWVITHTLKGCTNINIIGMDYYTELELSQLSELEAEGLIRIESDRIVIPDRQLLIETAQNWRDEDDI